MTTRPVDCTTLNGAVDFDSPFHLTPADETGVSILTPHIDGLYAPDVCHSDEHDVTVSDANWQPLTGHTGQDRYNGAVMHPSEFLGGGMADHVLAEGGTYVIVEVRDEDGSLPDGDAIGWAMLRYTGQVTA